MRGSDLLFLTAAPISIAATSDEMTGKGVAPPFTQPPDRHPKSSATDFEMPPAERVSLNRAYLVFLHEKKCQSDVGAVSTQPRTLPLIIKSGSRSKGAAQLLTKALGDILGKGFVRRGHEAASPIR